MNAAVWFGAAVFFVLGAGPAAHSQAMRDLLRAMNSPYFPYFSGAVAQIIAACYWYLHLVCSGIAVLHLVVEWLYLGRYLRRFWFWLLVGLVAAGLLATYGLEPKLKELHQTRFAAKLRLEQRVAADHSYRLWSGISTTLNILVTVGLGLNFWRVANPPDPTRFVSATKFRS